MYLEIGDKPIFNNDKKGAGLTIKSDKQFCYYLNSGRNALYEIIKLEKIKKVFVCSYNCYTVIEPFVKNNIEIELYDVDQNFTIKNLFDKLDNINNEECAVVLQNFYYSYYLDNIKLKLKNYTNVLVVEDITHSMLDDRTFDNADYYVGSIRKWAGTGEGGLLITDKAINNLPTNDGEIVELHSKMAKMQIEYISNRDQNLKAKYRLIQSNINNLFKEKGIQQINKTSLELINSIDYDYIKLKRRENCNYLMNKLKDFDFITIPIQNLDCKSVPLYLPIYVNNRDKLQHYLFKYNIYMPILWDIYEEMENKINEETRQIYNNILCLHIDQRYSKFDMDRICNVLLEYYENN